ncbi:MAG: hypothetical protein QOC81_3830 [Thermoanaerobaculia bacterium]|jgi:hypothetical protein|nr:hypothetical protein [Thermoanaerobaculia bacterium]
MFDSLLKAPSGAVAAAISRALTELFRVSDGRTLADIRNELAHTKTSMPEPKTARLLALNILEEIEVSKGKPLSALTARELRQISKSLSRILEEKIRTAPGYDQQAGAKILKELRRQYPGAVA